MKNKIIWLICLTLASCGNSDEGVATDRELTEKAIHLFDQKEIQMKQDHSHPEFLYRVVSVEQWQQSQLKNEVVNSSLDKDFIHLATEEQLSHIVQKFWSNKNHIILKLASKKLKGRLIKETNPGGSTLYYHLYEGNVPLDAVVEQM